MVETISDVLWLTSRAAYARLGFGILRDEVFEQVVLARPVEPTSKLDAICVLKGLGVDPPHDTTIYRHLRQAQDQRYRDRVAEQCFKHAATSGPSTPATMPTSPAHQSHGSSRLICQKPLSDARGIRRHRNPRHTSRQAEPLHMLDSDVGLLPE